MKMGRAVVLVFSLALASTALLFWSAAVLDATDSIRIDLSTTIQCDADLGQDWSPGDRSRLTRCWKSAGQSDWHGGGIQGFDPYGWATDLSMCKAMCDSIADCAVLVFTCDGRCKLKTQAAEWVSERDVPECRAVLSKVAPTTSVLGPVELQAAGVSKLLPPLPVLKPVAVAVLRCLEGLGWLEDLVRRLSAVVGEVQVILYERCVEPDQSRKLLGSAPLVRVSVPMLFSTPVYSITHLLATWRANEQGQKFRQTIFVDGRMSALEAKAVMDASMWVRWSDVEWADYILTTAGFTGVQIVDWSEGFRGRQEQYTAWTAKLLNWQAPVHVSRRGIERCPEAAQIARRNPMRRAIVTFLGGRSNLAAVRVLVHSIREQGSQTPILVAAVSSGSSDINPEWLGEFPPGIGFVEWPRIQQPAEDSASAVWEDWVAKLNLFNMTEYDELLFIDPHMLALQDVDAVFASKAVTGSASPLLAAPDWGRRQGPPSGVLSGAVLVLRPSAAIFKCILQAISSTPARDRSAPKDEQGFLRNFFGDTVVTLPFLYNAQDTTETRDHLWFNPDGKTRRNVTLLNFAGPKPHRTWSPPKFLRDFRSKEQKTRLRQARLNDDEDDRFPAISSPWKQSFFSLADFGQYLTMYGFYHDRPSFDALRQSSGARLGAVRRRAVAPKNYVQPQIMDPMALTEVVGPAFFGNGKAPKKMPKHLALTQFEGLLSLARASWYQKPWIGFTSAAELVRAERREGASLDWVKAEELFRRGSASRTVLFWCGKFAGDYWELLERHHKGMKSALLAVLRAMGFDVDSLIMPQNHAWPFGNYMIMPYGLLKEFAKFAKGFIVQFSKTYTRTCPFVTLENITDDFPNGCLAVTTERLIHVWSVLTRTSLEFVVDDPEIRYEAACAADAVHCRK
mmetsp:Transcript_117019/g.372512  ORF Transcript_117019/g.372512 Transcript_117019/m.372512 type:complete len:905 (+) Transcript_117019:77-2791(+)